MEFVLPQFTEVVAGGLLYGKAGATFETFPSQHLEHPLANQPWHHGQPLWSSRKSRLLSPVVSSAASRIILRCSEAPGSTVWPSESPGLAMDGYGLKGFCDPYPGILVVVPSIFSYLVNHHPRF